jgi:hypothetical protein
MRKNATFPSLISKELRQYFTGFEQKTRVMYSLKVEERIEEEMEPQPRLLQLTIPPTGRIPLLSIPHKHQLCSLLTVSEDLDVHSETSIAKESELESQSSTRDLGPIENSPYLDAIGQPLNNDRITGIVQEVEEKSPVLEKHDAETPTSPASPIETEPMNSDPKLHKIVLPVIKTEKTTPFEETAWVTQSLEQKLKSIRSMIYYHSQ